MLLGKPNNLPTFLIVGAAKAGTTSLYHYLKQHPQVFMSAIKEPKFFAFEGLSLNFKGNRKLVKEIRTSTVRDIESYKKLFTPKDNQIAIGEASPIYFHNREAPCNISKHIPNAKIIVVLRNPMERAYSDWQHNCREGYETTRKFQKAISYCERRESKNFAPYLNYLIKGYYARHLKRYLQFFDQRQIQVHLYEEFCQSPQQLLVSVSAFLGLEGCASIDITKKHMVGSKIYRHPSAASVASFLKGVATKYIGSKFDSIFDASLSKLEIPRKISREDYGVLLDYYREDILELQDLIKTDLTGWLNPVTRTATADRNSMAFS